MNVYRLGVSMLSGDNKMWPIEAIDMFAQDLEKTLQISVDRVATLSMMLDKIKQGDSQLRSFAETVVLKHKGMVEDVDKQINYWLSLNLTEKEHDKVYHCQVLAQKLHKIQIVYERSYQLFVTHLR